MQNLLHQRFQQLREQEVSWENIFKDVLGDVVESIELVFTKNQKARRVFEEILSDFYTRPDYWSQLFSATLGQFEVMTRLGTVRTRNLNPTVSAQFSDMTNEQVVLKYLGHLDPEAQREISVFDNLRGDQGYQAASLFYREYFYREADDYEILMFWQLILNSVIRDLLDRTTEELVEKALKERGDYVRRNVRRLALQIEQKGEMPLLQVSVQGQKIQVIKQNLLLPTQYSAEQLARKILIDASSNWLFTIPISIPGSDQPSDFLVVGPRYLAKTVRYTNYKLLASGQSLVYAREWVGQLMEEKEFNTLLSDSSQNEIFYTPASVLLDEKPTKDYVIRTLERAEAFEYVKGFHRYVPQANPRGYVTSIGAFDEDEKLVGALVLNTAQAAKRTGQYHIIEISRVVVQEQYRKEGISSMLVQWVIDNKNIFNRSQFDTANVVTYSLVKEPGTVYQRVKTLYPVHLVIPEARGRTNPLSDAFKIKWESDPETVRPWLPKLHPVLMKVYFGLNSYTNQPVSRELHSSDFRGLRGKEELIDVMKLFWLDKVNWQSVAGQTYRFYANKPIQLQTAIIDYINGIWLPVLFPLYTKYQENVYIASLDSITRKSDLIVFIRLCRLKVLESREKYASISFSDLKSRVLLLLNGGM